MNISLRELGRLLGNEKLASLRDSEEHALFLFPNGTCFGGVVHREEGGDEVLLHPAICVVTRNLGALLEAGPRATGEACEVSMSMIPHGAIFRDAGCIEFPCRGKDWDSLFAHLLNEVGGAEKSPSDECCDGCKCDHCADESDAPDDDYLGDI